MKKIRMNRGYHALDSYIWAVQGYNKWNVKERYAIGTTSLWTEQLKCLLLELDGFELGNSID